MYNKIITSLVVLSITVSYVGAMEPWIAASSMQMQSRSMKAVPAKQTPEQTLKAKQQELKEINEQLPMAPREERNALMARKKQLEKDIASMQK